MIKTVGIASLVAIMAWPSLARPADDDGKLQTVISALRNCVRSNAEAASLVGVRSNNEVAEFFRQRCAATVSDALAESKAAVPPGRFRFVIQQEWTAFAAGWNSK